MKTSSESLCELWKQTSSKCLNAPSSRCVFVVIACYLLAVVCVLYSPTRWAPGVHCSLLQGSAIPPSPSAAADIFTVHRASWLQSVRISFFGLLCVCVQALLTLNSWHQVP